VRYVVSGGPMVVVRPARGARRGGFPRALVHERPGEGARRGCRGTAAAGAGRPAHGSGGRRAAGARAVRRRARAPNSCRPGLFEIGFLQKFE
jgi:hypothetical protein